jgi:hypothetical protein
MAVNYQRFCPVCDAPFARGEAVIRCDGCGVLHHPACWNRNDGCQTKAEHVSRPVAIAFGVTPEPAPAQQIGESQRPARSELPRPPRPRHDPPYQTGFTPPPPLTRPQGVVPRRGLPKLYRDPARWVRYWYVPVAAMLAAGIAFAIVVIVDAIAGGPEPRVEPAASTTVVSDTPQPPRQETPTAVPTPGGTASPVPTTDGTGHAFAAGQQAVVTGTGDCLNVRAEPSTGGDIIACVPDGTVLTIVEGPRLAGGRSWWRARAPVAEGWVAEEYLVAR